MKIVKDTKELRDVVGNFSGSVGFVPTMGALHQGHLSLIQKAKMENKHVVVSIFVNPTQFLPGEDLDKYPKQEETDKKLCEEAGVDTLFMPKISSMYYHNEVKLKAPSYLGFILEGKCRPGHFDGVVQIVMKLLNLVQPNRAYFGKKDAQQLVILQKMVKDLFLPYEIVPVETVRDDDGLALSSRNIYLSTNGRKRALSISHALKTASKLITKGELSSDTIKAKMFEVMKDIDVEYIAIVDRDFKPIKKIEIENSIILVAAKVGQTRLIDNLWI